MGSASAKMGVARRRFERFSARLFDASCEPWSLCTVDVSRENGTTIHDVKNSNDDLLERCAAVRVYMLHSEYDEAGLCTKVRWSS